MNQDVSAFRDFWEIAALPAAAGLAALAVTWVIWYFTGTRCTDGVAAATGCNPSAVAAFINPALLKDIITNSAIAATGGGIWSYIMITRERRAREAAEQARQAAEQARQAAEQARQAAEQALEQERERAKEERQRAEDERRRADDERQKTAEERQKADEERSSLLAQIERLTRQLDAQQNGNK